jgi:hypothetical protein
MTSRRDQTKNQKLFQKKPFEGRVLEKGPRRGRNVTGQGGPSNEEQIL